MNILKTVLLWIAALVVVAFVVRRLRRRERLLLDGRYSPRFVRMLAVLIVWFGWRPDDAHAAPDPDCTSLPVPSPTPSASPASPTAPTFHPTRPRLDLATLVGGCADPAALATLATLDILIKHHVDRVAEHRTASLFQLARDLASQRSLTPVELLTLTDLFRDADRRAVLHEAVIRALAEVGPPVFRPWMSKAAPPPGWRNTPDAPPGFRPALERALASVTAGTWESESTLTLEVVSGVSQYPRAHPDTVAALIRHGERHPLELNAFTLGRLDIVTASADAPLVLKHPTLGTMTIPAGHVLTAWNAPTYLTEPATQHLTSLVAAASKCDRAAQATLLEVLPAAHSAIRTSLTAPRATPGQPALRLLLTLFDE